MNFAKMFTFGLFTLLACVFFVNCQDFQIRLVDGPSASAGRVEVSKDGINWGTVCDDLWTSIEATVTCKELGYSWGENHYLAHFGPGQGFIYLDNMDCSGHETKLSQCAHNGWGVNNCHHGEDASVSCYNTTVRTRSVAKTGYKFGTVQILLSGAWLDICDPGWDDKEATIACNHLGYDNGKAFTESRLGISSFSSSSASLTSFQCNGTEATLQDCAYTYSDASCLYNTLASIMCSNGELNMDFAMNVEGPSGWGRVTVRYSGVWGTVCGESSWSDSAATMICKSRGYTGGVGYSMALKGDKPVWIKNFKCLETETSLDACVTKWGEPTYAFSCDEAYVHCYYQDFYVSLVGGNSIRAGTVVVTYDGVNGTICNSNWGLYEARALCLSLGYNSGTVVPGSYYGAGTGEVYLDDVDCSYNSRSILSCSNSGWMTNISAECLDHSHDAGVTCHQDVRLINGDHSAGQVQANVAGSWNDFCNGDINHKAARVICRELGFSNGSALDDYALGSKYTYSSTGYELLCLGNETSITNCPRQSATCPGPSIFFGSYEYATIGCFDGVASTGLDVKIVSASADSFTGNILIKKRGVWGQPCPSYWDDREANVACKMQGYAGGISFALRTGSNKPFTVTNLNCTGMESSIMDCAMGGELCDIYLYSYGNAGVLCHDAAKPVIKLADSTLSYGRLEVVVDGVAGAICDYFWGDTEANVVCKQMGYSGGEVYSSSTMNTLPTVMTYVDCTGSEKSLFSCKSNAWKEMIDRCTDNSKTAGARCYGNVRLDDGIRTNTSYNGAVFIYKDDVWKPMCSDTFDSNDAKTACKELGFRYSQVISPGAFGSSYLLDYLINIECTGTETTVITCPSAMGKCPGRKQAALACSETPFDTAITTIIDTTFPSYVTVQKFGINGSICNENWDDVDASVVCREKGYAGGIAIGYKYEFITDRPIFFTKFNCLGSEPRLMDCDNSDKIDRSSCSGRSDYARVVCYRSAEEPTIRLTNGFQGRVEIKFDGQWGTVCDSYVYSDEAEVICRHLGYNGGSSYAVPDRAMPTYYNWIYSPYCMGGEKKIWHCSNSGWNITSSTCSSLHTNDAGVKCSGNVKIQPNSTYGYVELWNGVSYDGICADDFDDLDATVACRESGYDYGMSMCCRSFGYRYTSININKLACRGTEASLSECPMVKSTTMCAFGNYAALVCSNVQHTGGFSVGLPHDYYGSLMIKYFGHWGYVCSDGFDDNAAKVVCRNQGYTNGFAYVNNYGYAFSSQIRWLANISCTGDEIHLSRCAIGEFGQFGQCASYGNAAVHCYNDQGPQFRLANRTGIAGRVEMSIDGVWGTVCGSVYGFTDTTASLICKNLGFGGGYATPRGFFGTGGGKMWIGSFSCSSNAESIFDCAMEFGDDLPSTCMHDDDVGVYCYEDVRLAGVHEAYFGRVEVKVENKWLPVCDSGFDHSNAAIICRELGYQHGLTQCCSPVGSISPDNDTVTNIQCTGAPNSLADCRRQVNKCPSGKTVAAYCSRDPLTITAITVQKIISTYGMVKVTKYGFPGPICVADWDDKDANVTCVELGFKGGVAKRTYSYNPQPIFVGKFNCKGNEKTLESCPYAGINEDVGCSRSDLISYTSKVEVAGMLCHNHKDGIKFRLSGGSSPNRGRVEVFYEGFWMRVCGSTSIFTQYWNDAAADVLCRQIGYVTGEMSTREPAGAGRVRMNYIRCTGSEDSLLQCENTWITYSSTYCTADAAVVCYNSIRVAGGDQQSHGVVQLYMNNIWSTVCGAGWSSQDSDVTCKALGYEHGLSACCSPYGYFYSENLAMDNVKCVGSETDLMDCPHSTAITGSCTAYDYAAVACYNGIKAKSYNISLGKDAPNTGKVQLTYLDITGHICSDGWDDKDAKVVCKELGFSNGEAYYHSWQGFFEEYYGPWWTSNVACLGTENKLSDCKSDPWGSVSACVNKSLAGVLCYTNGGTYFDMVGDKVNFGRLRVSVDGVWGSVCRSTWDYLDAHVFCVSQGYTSGGLIADNTVAGPADGTPVYQSSIACTGNEKSLKECSHIGWQLATSTYCKDLTNFATAFCYATVALALGDPISHSDAPLMVFHNNSWNYVCDIGVNDATARLACRELGFPEGKSICCDAYSVISRTVNTNMTVSCDGSENSFEECIKDVKCDSEFYATVMCLNASDAMALNEDYLFRFLNTSETHGRVVAEHYGISGGICSDGWDDTDAQVFCKSLGHKDGLAYYHALFGRYDEAGLPFFAGSFNCTGDEKTLNDCPFGDRFNLGNCSVLSRASALCFSEGGIQYRLANGTDHSGRVEMSVGGVWGTVCDYFFDDRDASVFCRGKGFKGGYDVSNGHFGAGSGTVWLSHLQCTGNETSLHQCIHRGYDIEEDTFGLCAHRWDAGVVCYNSVRLNTGFNASQGAVEVFNENKKEWNTICDASFASSAARIVCRELGFNDGIAVPGSVFGDAVGPIGVSSAACDGHERDLMSCTVQWGSACSSNTYASVYCSHDDLVDDGFHVNFADNIYDKHPWHGYIGIKVNGVWGTICPDTWNDKSANVACKEMKFTGGVNYVPYGVTNEIMLYHGLTCNGNEASLVDCNPKDHGGSECDYTTDRAGALCYTGEGLKYRLAGGPDSSEGIIEISYNGEWGNICSYGWDVRDASVACRQTGFADGLAMSGSKYTSAITHHWITFLSCSGDENAILMCPSYGFNSTNFSNRFVEAYYCQQRHPSAAKCYTNKIAITNIRIQGSSKGVGRVEVYVSGANSWGTVCDDGWDDLDATVVCRQLGFAQGEATLRASFGEGSGPVWLDDVGCHGNETKLADCKHSGIAFDNCRHAEDAGVICTGDISDLSTPSTSTSTTTMKPPTPSPRPKTSPTTGSTNPSTTTSGKGATDSSVGKQPAKVNLTAAIAAPVVILVLIIAALGAFYMVRRHRAGAADNKFLVNSENVSQAGDTSSVNLDDFNKAAWSKI